MLPPGAPEQQDPDAGQTDEPELAQAARARHRHRQWAEELDRRHQPERGAVDRLEVADVHRRQHGREQQQRHPLAGGRKAQPAAERHRQHGRREGRAQPQRPEHSGLGEQQRRERRAELHQQRHGDHQQRRRAAEARRQRPALGRARPATCAATGAAARETATPIGRTIWLARGRARGAHAVAHAPGPARRPDGRARPAGPCGRQPSRRSVDRPPLRPARAVWCGELRRPLDPAESGRRQRPRRLRVDPGRAGAGARHDRGPPRAGRAGRRPAASASTARSTRRCSTTATCCWSTSAAPAARRAHVPGAAVLRRPVLRAPPSPPIVGRCGDALNAGGVHGSDLYATAYAAEDLAAVIRALGVAPVDLYGDSYGTFLVQSFMARHPELAALGGARLGLSRAGASTPGTRPRRWPHGTP